MLASAARLTDPFPGLMQRRWLEYCRAGLTQVERLVALGCGMGDCGVNELVGEWLAGSSRRRLEIVAPGALRLPAFLDRLADQVELVPAATTTYLEQLSL